MLPVCNSHYVVFKYLAKQEISRNCMLYSRRDFPWSSIPLSCHFFYLCCLSTQCISVQTYSTNTPYSGWEVWSWYVSQLAVKKWINPQYFFPKPFCHTDCSLTRVNGWGYKIGLVCLHVCVSVSLVFWPRLLTRRARHINAQAFSLPMLLVLLDTSAHQHFCSHPLWTVYQWTDIPCERQTLYYPATTLHYNIIWDSGNC